MNAGALAALASIIVIDLVLAGDNAIVVGLAAAGLPPAVARKVIFLGMIFATVLRIALSLVAVQILAIIGLTLAGGILLLWVVWKLYRDLRAAPAASEDHAAAPARPKTFSRALLQVVAADVSMSLDNVLAIAGTARDHIYVLVLGLALSVALTGVASAYVARLIERHRWIAWLGLAIVAFVALKMIYEGSAEIIHAAPWR
jgi:YjbE family integral membrane protein